MSAIYIHYGNLQDSVNQASKARKELFDYSDEIKRRVTNPISKLSGRDSKGYASTASSLAWKKINSLSQKADRLGDYENTINGLISKAKEKDRTAANRIEQIANLKLEPRNWFQKAGDAIYNFFCVDVANKWGWTKTISDTIKNVHEDVRYNMEKIGDWFKYGDGKYLANIGKAVLGAVLAVGGAIAAIVSIPVTGTAAIVIGVVSAVAATVGMVITLYNSQAQIMGNIKAYQLADEHPGAARYYGNISTLHEQWDKTDMGDATTNARYDTAGNVIDTTKFVTDVTQTVCNVAKLGLVNDFRFKPGHGYKDHLDFSWNNIKRNILHDLNFYTSKIGKKNVKWYQTVNWKEAFDVKKLFGGYSKSKFMVDEAMVIPEAVYHVLNTAKIIKNTTDTISDVVKIHTGLTNGKWKDLIDPISDLSEVIPVIGPSIENGKEFNDLGSDLIDLISGFKETTAEFPKVETATSASW